MTINRAQFSCAADTLHKRIYVAGGIYCDDDDSLCVLAPNATNRDPYYGAIQSVESFDHATDTWIVLDQSPMTVARNFFSLVGTNALLSESSAEPIPSFIPFEMFAIGGNETFPKSVEAWKSQDTEGNGCWSPWSLLGLPTFHPMQTPRCRSTSMSTSSKSLPALPFGSGARKAYE